METFKGTIKLSNISGRIWELVTETGERYQIMSKDKTIYVDDLQVIIRGEIDDNLMGIGMNSGILKVVSWEKISSR